jgi:hypothetical protein
MPDQIELEALPEQGSPDYFRLLVRNCIKTYAELPNDAMCLDYNKVSGKLRALVLDDAEYRQETRNMYAKQRLEELREVDALAKLTLCEDMGGDEDEDDPRNRRKKKKSGGMDKDMLNMRIKAVQMRRELVASMNEDNKASERDAVNLLYIAMSAAEIAEAAKNELHGDSSDDALDELASPKEEAPTGSSGKIRIRGQSASPDDEDSFDVLPDGEIVER